MGGAGRDQDFFAGCGAQGFALKLELNLAFDEHHHLIDRVHEILPLLTGGVDPDIAAKATLGLAPFDLFQSGSHCAFTSIV